MAGWRRFRLLGLLLVLLLAATGAAQAQGQPPELVFVQPEKLAVNFSGEESDEATVWLKNPGQKTITPRFAAALEDSDGNPVGGQVEVVDAEGQEVRAKQLQAGEVGRYRIRFAEASKSSGQLLASAEGLATASLPISLGPELTSTRGVNGALVVPFGAALLLLSAAWIFGRGNTRLTDSLSGATELDFSKSFASTLTGVGALLGTIIAATGVLPEETVNLSKAGFTGLNLTFGIAIVIAAAIASSAQSSEPIWNKDGQEEWKVKGYVLAFLAAAMITLWAVFGELWTIWLLIEELGAEKGFTSLGVVVLQILLALAAAAMVPYTFFKVKIAVDVPEPPGPAPVPAPPAPPPPAGPAAAAVAEPPAEEVGEALPPPVTLL
jgi:hypothetical protein